MLPGYELAGRYVLEELLGQGAVGEVWRARDRELDRAVAVKVIRERISDPKLARGFLGEARIAGRLQHPGVTVVHDVGEDGGQPFIVMELLHGRDLDTVLRDYPGGMPADQVVSLAIQFADALGAAHAGGVVHRDLKPANLFLQDNGQLKICDFGIAVAADATSLPASFSYVVGTPAYMSPEQCDGQQAGESADLYSLGCVLYALLTGRPPFTAGPPLAVMSQHRTSAPAAPRALRPAVPAGLDQLVVDLLAKDPVARPENARQVATALRALRGKPGAITAPPRQAPAPPRQAPAPPVQAPAPPVQAPAPVTPEVTRPPSDPVVVKPRQVPAAGRQAVVLRAHSRAIHAVCAVTIGDRQLLATASSDRTARLWDPATRSQIAVLLAHTNAVNAVCAVTIGDRQLLATASSDRTARLWDPATRQQIASFVGHEREVNAVCPITVGDRQLLATASSDRTARLWDPATRQQVAVLRASTHAINGMCPITVGDRQLLATAGSDRTARLWDPVSGEQAAVLKGHEREVNAVCPITAGGGQLLATASSDGTARLWDPATRQQVAVLLAHSNDVNAVCPVTAGWRQLLATAGSDHTVELWNPAAKWRVTVSLWHKSAIIKAVCPVTVGDQQLLATGSSDGTLRLWDPATGQPATVLA